MTKRQLETSLVKHGAKRYDCLHITEAELHNISKEAALEYPVKDEK
jgi:hypothetical protein